MIQIPVKAQEIINEHLVLLEKNLPGFVAGYYLYGSVALGAFNDGYSDIDFFAVVTRKATPEDLKVLEKIHTDLHRKFHRRILDGMYVPEEDLGSTNDGNWALRFNEGAFKGYKQFDHNSIDAFQLKKYGLKIQGKETVVMDYCVVFDILLDQMRVNLNTYWRHWADDCKRFPSGRYFGLLLSLGTVEWGVLGISRLYYTFVEKDIISKIGAGEYALGKLPQHWHKIIKEAMRLRKGHKKSYYDSIFARRNDALSYIDTLIGECNKLIRQQQ